MAFNPLEHKKGVPRRDNPSLQRYHEVATVLHVEQSEGDIAALADAIQVPASGIAWDYLDKRPPCLRIVYLGVNRKPAEEARAALELAADLCRKQHQPPLRIAIGTGRLFYIEEPLPGPQRNLAGLLLQALDILAAACLHEGDIVLNEALQALLQQQIETDDLGTVENEQGIPLRAFRFRGWKMTPEQE